MKKRLSTLLLISILTIAAYSQTPRPAYCELMAWNFWGGAKCYVELDIGADSYGTICDSTSKPVKFNSPIDALNYMAKLGWSLQTTYYITDTSSKHQIIHYVLVKQVTDDSQISSGIYIKPKKEKKPYERGKEGDDLY